ncbi:MAG: histidinol-phosphatase, partial [Solirubrobacteraceae bacterium]|nr:histidinol-phosphatase [Solirubrobacteraceae bacterium]
ADRAVERAVREHLATTRPGDAVVGEEYGVSAGAGSARRWIVDPIDGTKSYVRGVPVWATLVALEEDGELSVGVVSAPALNRRWWAARGTGAWARENGVTRSLRVSRIRDLSAAQLCFSDYDSWQGEGRLDGLLELSARCWRTRGYGDFWQHMLVAEGAAEIAVDPGVSVWDLAAVLIVVREAGGRLTDLEGAERADGGDGVSTNGLLHAEVLAALSR